MTDYFRKPAPGTAARDQHDAAEKKLRKPCGCGSKLRTTQRANHRTCIACDPNTKAAYAKLRGKSEGNK